MRPYELIDHTADLGIAVTAENIADLFESAAHAMFDQIIDRAALSGAMKEIITAAGIDKADLMINWLRELLFFWNGRERLVKRVQVEQIRDARIRASLWHDPYDPDAHEILSDIKAVTYHGIKVKKSNGRWTATIIFDV